MIHLGDITKIRGDEIHPVDCITGGSPCQDLSVAGKRAGLEGERSGLFMEQIRIVKEMRERDRRAGRTAWAVRPRFMVWENVPGAFSSNGGKDFQAVLTEIVKIVEPDAPDVPLPDKGKWPHSGCLYSDMGDWSVAWRLHDAQFWGVPQRRKRIALVADFGGLAAPEVLFEREGLSRDPEPRGAEVQGTAAAAQGGTGTAEPILLESNQNNATVQTNGVSTALPASMGMGGGYVPMVTDKAYCHQGNGIDRADTARCNGRGWREDQSYTLNTIDRPAVCIPDVAHALSARHDGSPQPDKGNGANIVCVDAVQTYSNQAIGQYAENDNVVISSGTDVADTLDASYYKGTGSRNGKERTVVCVGNGQLNQVSMAEQSNTLDTMHDQQAVLIAAVDCRNATENAMTNGTLQAKSNGGISYNLQNVCRTGQTVRRLTPLECERLQGFPDGWTDIGEWTDTKGKRHKPADSPRYKALGNSIALPFWFWLMRRISAQYERPATLGSLFDGIGGFPLCWERCNGKGTAVWASEIEEFPIAVTKKHFPEEE